MIQPVGEDEQPVEVCVKVNLAFPPEIPVAIPESFTVAIAELLETQCPPVVGERVVVTSSQIVLAPVILTTGLL